MSNTNLAKKRKSSPNIKEFILGEDFTDQIKSNIREDLQVLYEKQIEQFNQLNAKLNYLEEQLRTIQSEMKVLIELNTKTPQQDVSIPNRRKADAIFQSYLT